MILGWSKPQNFSNFVQLNCQGLPGLVWDSPSGRIINGTKMYKKHMLISTQGLFNMSGFELSWLQSASIHQSMQVGCFLLQIISERLLL